MWFLSSGTLISTTMCEALSRGVHGGTSRDVGGTSTEMSVSPSGDRDRLRDLTTDYEVGGVGSSDRPPPSPDRLRHPSGVVPGSHPSGGLVCCLTFQFSGVKTRRHTTSRSGIDWDVESLELTFYPSDEPDGLRVTLLPSLS